MFKVLKVTPCVGEYVLLARGSHYIRYKSDYWIIDDGQRQTQVRDTVVLSLLEKAYQEYKNATSTG